MSSKGTASVLVAACLLSVASIASAQTLNIGDVTMVEGASGTQAFSFNVTLTAPAPPGGVTFDIATADGTAQDDNPATEDNDYVAQALTGQTIPAGATGPYVFAVTVNGDVAAEATELFFVNVTNITGATAGDVQGIGTITNDDVSITPIHDVQGPGASSPIVGSTVAVRGIVTGVEANGFFVQEEDAEVDADPATSQGVFVFTSATPPPAAAFSAQVQVTGTVAEFVPVSDPLQPPLTQLTSPSVAQLAPPGQPLPAAIPLTASFPDPAGPFDQLERVEGMRVSVASLTVTSPSAGAIDETNATATSNGIFHGVVTGLPRPFREAGIQAPDPTPSGSIPPIPRWDGNPERLRIDSGAINAQPILDVKTRDLVGPLVGPLEYAFRGYTILPDGTLGTPGVVPGSLGAHTVSPAAGHEVTVASLNLQRFFDTVNDPGIGEPVLTATAYDNRLEKASIATRQHLRHPDIIGVQEVENLNALQAIATRVNAAAGPQYTPFLFEGNDVSGIDVGLLVKTTEGPGGPSRVSVDAVTQVLAGELAVNPDASTELLWQRPPLVLEGTVSRSAGTAWPIVVIVAHMLGAEDIGSPAPGGNGWPTIGARVRARRLQQASSLADYVQGRQTADPGEHLVLLGGFAALEMNDGYVDVMNVIAGTPPPDNQTAVPGDGVDLVIPDLMNLVATPPAAERYSHVADGHARAVDHVLVGAGVVADTSARRIEYARIGADFPETARNDASTAYRLSEHDPVVAYLATDDLLLAELSVSVSDNPDPVTIGTQLAYTVIATNSGPDPATSVTLSVPLPTATRFVSLSIPAGWSCTTPPAGAAGTVTCNIAAMTVSSATFVLTVSVDASVSSGTVLVSTASVVATSPDSTPGNNTATTTTVAVNGPPTVSPIADQTIPEDTSTSALPFTIGDLVTPAASLVLSGTSSDTTLVPHANIVFGGSGANRTVVVTPAADQHGGPVTMTVTVSDGEATASETFLLTVVPAGDAPTLTGLVDDTIEETQSATQTLTLADDDTSLDALTVSVVSSNQALLPDGAVTVTGTGATRTLTMTPIEELTGETLITVTVGDGELTSTHTARLVVTPAPPPDPPTGLVGTAVGNEVTLTWNAPAAGATPTFYVLEGGTSPGATMLPVVNTRSRGTEWGATLPAGTYYVRVRAANRAGTSDRSNEASVVVGGVPALPGPPSAFLARVVGSQVTVQWVPGTVGGPPSVWRIEAGSAPGARDLGIVHVRPDATTASGSLAPGAYFLRVRGMNAAGQGPASHEVRIQIGPMPTCAVPEAPVLLPATVVDRTAQIIWREARNTTVANYRVFVGTQPGVADLHTLDVGPVTAFGAQAAPGEYFVWVVATNNCGVSPASNVVRVEIGAGPPAPANLRASVNGSRVTLGWDAVPRVDGYLLEVGTASGLADIAAIPTTAEGFAAGGVAPGTYHMRVRAVRGGVRGQPSGEVVLVVP